MSEERYTITYLNLETGRREYFMNKTSFILPEVKHEIKLLKEAQDRREQLHLKRTRAKFQKKKI